jgi:phosphatidylglycerol:prolipoprotein diacylglycerol transferase
MNNLLLAIPYPAWIHPEIFPGVPFLRLLRWYGLMYVFAFGTAYLVFRKLIKAGALDSPGRPATEDDALSFFSWGIIFLLIGARVFSALVYDTTDIYRQKPWLIFWPFAGGRFTGLAGMSYHGGYIGGLLGMICWSLYHKRPILKWVDGMVIAIPAGYTWGRIGNFLNGELFGRVTTVPWGMIFPNAERFSYSIPWVREIADKAHIPAPAGGGLVNLPRHPSQLYEALFEGLILFLTLWLLFKFFSSRKGKPFDGFFSWAYTAGYGLVRFFIEYFREPDTDLGYRIEAVAGSPTYRNVSFLNISTGQILCLLMITGAIIASIACYALQKRRNR